MMLNREEKEKIVGFAVDENTENEHLRMAKRFLRGWPLTRPDETLAAEGRKAIQFLAFKWGMSYNDAFQEVIYISACGEAAGDVE